MIHLAAPTTRKELAEVVSYKKQTNKQNQTKNLCICDSTNRMHWPHKYLPVLTNFNICRPQYSSANTKSF